MKHVKKKMWNKYTIPVASGVLLVLLTLVALYRWVSQAHFATDTVVAEHIVQLKNIFEKIDKACDIISFEHDRNYIDFLNVKNFSGSQVGPMNLKRPEHWQGPYVEENPTIQGKPYEIIKNREGYVIVPGDGVRLSNGKVMGKDIIINYDTDVDSYINDKGGLEYKGHPLAVRIHVKKGLEMLDLSYDDEVA